MTGTIDEKVMLLAREIYKQTNKGIKKEDLDFYDKLESISFFNITPAVSLKYGGFGIIGHHTFGPCGTMSRVLLNSLWKLGIKARKLQLHDNEEGKGGGHTLVEFYNNKKWAAISPARNGFVWRNKKGEIASAEEIKNNFDIFKQIYINSAQYPYLFDNPKYIRWEKLPAGAVNIIHFFMGDERFNNAETPELYDNCRKLFFLTSLFITIILGVLCIITFLFYFKTRSSQPRPLVCDRHRLDVLRRTVSGS